MKQREILKTVHGRATEDGAGVRLVRILSNGDVEDFDPFLMLDSFDSTDPSDYTAGFPMHPHRGIETITYLISGEIDHQDSMGNRGAIRSGESQWMTAGSGILHQEMPQPSERMLGFQLWLNLPRAEKMAPPAYLSITQDMIPAVHSGKAEIRVLSGRFGDTQGVRPRHIPATVLDISLPAGAGLTIPSSSEETAFLFLIQGSAEVNTRAFPAKTAVLLGAGSEVSVAAPAGSPSRIIYFSGRPLHEPVAWGGPIVMNTQEELRQAFDELRSGTFIRG